MKRQPTVELFDLFEGYMCKYMPSFKLADSSEFPHGCVLYKNERCEKFSSYVLLYRLPNRNRFDIDAAWSIHRRFPLSLPAMAVLPITHADIPIDEPIDGEFRFKPRQLWDTRITSWRYSMDNKKNIENVIQMASKYLVSYLDQVDPTKAGGWSNDNANLFDTEKGEHV